MVYFCIRPKVDGILLQISLNVLTIKDRENTARRTQRQSQNDWNPSGTQTHEVPCGTQTHVSPLYQTQRQGHSVCLNTRRNTQSEDRYRLAKNSNTAAHLAPLNGPSFWSFFTIVFNTGRYLGLLKGPKLERLLRSIAKTFQK